MGSKEKSIGLSVMKLAAVVVFVIAAGVFADVCGTGRWSSAFAAALSEKDISGIFSVSLPAASSPGRKIELRLNEDGEARMTEDYLDGDSPIESEGKWKFNPDEHKVTVNFPDNEMIFLYADGKLDLVDYNVDVWGENGLSLTKSAE
jgi:uncharacterized lipoprotein NlpE involved in copper resistance